MDGTSTRIAPDPIAPDHVAPGHCASGHRGPETPRPPVNPLDPTPTERPSSPETAAAASAEFPENDYSTRRESKVDEYAEEAFHLPTPLESNLALLSSELMRHLASLNKRLGQAVERTEDPMDQLQLFHRCLPEVSKLSREIRALTEILTRAERQRYAEELAWTRANAKPR